MALAFYANPPKAIVRQRYFRSESRIMGWKTRLPNSAERRFPPTIAVCSAIIIELPMLARLGGLLKVVPSRYRCTANTDLNQGETQRSLNQKASLGYREFRASVGRGGIGDGIQLRFHPPLTLARTNSAPWPMNSPATRIRRAGGILPPARSRKSLCSKHLLAARFGDSAAIGYFRMSTPAAWKHNRLS